MSFIDRPYSTSAKQFYGPVPVSDHFSPYASTAGQFRIARMPQTDILDAIEEDPIEIGHLRSPYDVSLKDSLLPVATSVGMVLHEGSQLGSCTLISPNVAIVPCHCIEGIDVRNISALFNHVYYRGAQQQTFSYRMEYILEADPELDYALVVLEGQPGKHHGFLPISSSLPHAEPALLHHPLNKPLKLSIHAYVHTDYQVRLLSTYHDSDYGSSGGAYVGPSGKFFALHLGCARHVQTLSLMRLALPVDEIIRKNPNSFLAPLTKDVPCYPVYSLPRRLRSYIDLEAYDRSRLLHDGAYQLIHPTSERPGVIIEQYQAKHTPVWPMKWGGQPGAHLPLTLDDTIALAERLVQELPLLQTIPQAPRPSLQSLPVQKDTVGKSLYKKLADFKSIKLYAAYSKPKNSWEIHFYPDRNRV